MDIFSEHASLSQKIKAWHSAGLTVAFVPTMGNLHLGHLSLVEQAKALADKVIVSILVNPLQFDNADDLRRYPRTLEQDKSKLIEQGNCDALFLPNVDEVYPNGMAKQTKVHVPDMDDKLCGRHRPGHFDGVATVVLKLFNMIQPDIAVFGEKDFQQLSLIKRMVQDLNLAIDIVPGPTYREDDGLAMSSRNQYLTPDQRRQASFIYQTMKLISEKVQTGNKDFQLLCQQASKDLNEAGFVSDYVDIRRESDLALANEQDRSLRIFIAVQLGKARLIDNLAITLPEQA